SLFRNADSVCKACAPQGQRPCFDEVDGSRFQNPFGERILVSDTGFTFIESILVSDTGFTFIESILVSVNVL
ncbi:MAG: hypothetical protein KBT22_01530, partial [Bacteroidales bacterium]|nr:hypothetical protein [Candidatus Scybalocola fimicaballi]